jgi:ribonuclease HI
VVVKAFTTLAEAQAFVRGEFTSQTKQPSEPKFYGVQVGKVPGVYLNWPQAQVQIQGVKGPKYKKFNTRAEAEAFVAQGRKNNGGLADAQLSPEKKHKQDMINRSAPGLVTGSTYVAKDANGNAFEPGTGPLPPGAEDGFDPNITLNAAGQVVHKTEAEKEKTKLISKERDPPGMLTIYTDGSSLRNGHAGARAGVGVFFGPGDPRYASTVPSPDYYESTLPHSVYVIDQARSTYTKEIKLQPN